MNITVVKCPHCGVEIELDGPGRFACFSCGGNIEAGGRAAVPPVQPAVLTRPIPPSRIFRNVFWVVLSVIGVVLLLAVGVFVLSAVTAGVTEEVAVQQHAQPIQIYIDQSDSDAIAGELTNTTGETIDARVEFALYRDGAKVGDARDRIWKLGAGERWKFKASTHYDNFTQWRLQRLVVNGSEVNAKTVNRP